MSGSMSSDLRFRELRWMLSYSTRRDVVWSIAIGIYKDPFPHPALRDGVVSRLLSCVGWAMAIARLTHLRISIPSSGAPPGQVPAECFPGRPPRCVHRAVAMCHSRTRSPCWGTRILQCAHRKRSCRH